MGLFDELIFEIEDEALEKAPERPYQTKSLGCTMTTYYVKPDRRLYRRDFITWTEALASCKEAWDDGFRSVDTIFKLVDTHFHGDLHFTYFGGEIDCFIARFTEGVLQWVRRVEENYE